MRPYLFTPGLVVVISSLVLAGPVSQTAKQEVKPEEELTNVVRQWLDAEARSDRAALSALIADDFIGTAFGGNLVNKDDIVPPEGESSGRFPKSNLKEATARVFGDAGVVMGLAGAEGAGQGGQFRFTVVCVKRTHGWQMAAAHLAHVAP